MKGIKLNPNSAFMELKNTNPIDNNVGASNLINVNFLVLKTMKNEFKNKHQRLVFPKDVLIA